MDRVPRPGMDRYLRTWDMTHDPIQTLGIQLHLLRLGDVFDTVM